MPGGPLRPARSQAAQVVGVADTQIGHPERKLPAGTDEVVSHGG
jgi:hypothetical protein